MGLSAVYCDLDGTLLGPDGSLLAAPGGGTTLLGARAVEACLRSGAEFVVMTGRGRESAFANARLLGQTSYIFEVGAAFVIEGEEHWLTGDWVPRDSRSIHDLITDSGAPALLLEHFAGRLEPHAPWDRGREVSHLMRGDIDAPEAEALLAEHGIEGLRVVDNGEAHRASPELAAALDRLRVYHVLPAGASKARAVSAHARARGYDPAQCIACGDSAEDIGVAAAVGRFFLVANAVERDPGIRATLREHANATVTEASNGEGVYEAVVSTLAGA